METSTLKVDDWLKSNSNIIMWHCIQSSLRLRILWNKDMCTCIHVCRRDGKMIRPYFVLIASHVLIFGVWIWFVFYAPFPSLSIRTFVSDSQSTVFLISHLVPTSFFALREPQPTFSSSTSSTWGSSQICRRIPVSTMVRILWERNNKAKYTPHPVSSHCNNCLIFDRLILNMIFGHYWFQVLHDPFVSWK